jgi:hypothetical protein
MGMMPPSMGMGMPNGGVVAVLSLGTVKDMPYPRNPNLTQVIITVIGDSKGKSVTLNRLGPFSAKQQRGQTQLVDADCLGQRVTVQSPMHFGGVNREGAMYFRLSVSFTREGTDQRDELVGTTDPFKVGFENRPAEYIELKMPRTEDVMGGITVSSRLATEAEAMRGERQMGGPVPGAPPPIDQAIEAPYLVRGRTGTFQPFSIEEANEAAAIIAEAQNRALLQRCKKGDLNFNEENDCQQRRVGKFRQWANLDALFTTMGPNPLAMSEEVGAQVCRGYHDYTSVMKEVGHMVGPNLSPADAAVNAKLVQQMSKQPPWMVQTTVRPVICKSPDEIALSKDMRWLPDPPVYMPVRNMTPEDQETLRLACYDPSQSAALMFADVNPNYDIDNDIWEVAEEEELMGGMLPRRRVKDECLMA